MFESTENAIVSKALIRALKEIDAKAEKTKWLLKIVSNESTKNKELSPLLLQLDKVGIRKFARFMCRNNYPKKNVDTLKCAKKISHRRNFKLHINEIARYFNDHDEKTILLANGIPCVLAREKRSSFPGWRAELTAGKTRMRLALWIDQLATLNYGVTNDISILKRMKPRTIEYKNNGKWQTMPEHAHHAALVAIAERTPLEIAMLLN